ncbi:MAG TPA: PadR family transcriptional regulator [Anaerolineales bacterium]|jgi:DNA-binding PadR family transcriptional regulator|nr:PadR family transcriptional regulator [Anaerolineales bacterium]
MKLPHYLFLGFVKLHILHHAGREAVYGLWLIEELAKHGYRLSPGTLYPILHGMEREKLLASKKRVVEGKSRRYYVLTRTGRKALQEGKRKAVELLEEIQ